MAVIEGNFSFEQYMSTNRQKALSMARRFPVFATFLLILIDFVWASAPNTADDSFTAPYNRPAATDSCPKIKGNPDFYGLGIRIGVYLQWFSSWISNTVNPSAAATNHDANTIFLIAVLSALATALTKASELRLVEMYIMLLLSSGFVFTVLSILGLRLHFLQPLTLKLFRKRWHDSRKQSQTQGKEGRLARAIRAILPDPEPVLKKHLMEFSFRAASGVKHPSLSWAGVVVRSATVSLLAALSTWVWFKHDARYSTDDNDNGCENTLFFFGVRKPTGDLLRFFRVASVALAVVPTGLLIVSAAFTLKFVIFGELWLARHAAAKFFGKENWNKLGNREKQALGIRLALMKPKDIFDSLDIGVKSRQLYRRIQAQVYRRPSPADEARTWDKNGQFWAADAHTLPQLSDLLQGYMSLLSRGVESQTQSDAVDEDQTRSVSEGLQWEFYDTDR